MLRKRRVRRAQAQEQAERAAERARERVERAVQITRGETASAKPMSHAETLLHLNASIEDAIAHEYPPEEIERLRWALERHQERGKLRLLQGGSQP